MENNFKNPFVAEQENGGLCDETLEMFQEFMAMVNVTSLHPGIDLECAICMNILIWPNELDVCKHVFCHPCLIRLIQAGGLRCPLCRAVSRESNPLRDLQNTIEIFYEDYYQERSNVERESGIFRGIYPRIENGIGIFNIRIQRVAEDGTVTYYFVRRL